ncbi:MAG: hypothetical protein GYB67_16415 [Chloroflexi bacterium]|nr:hypothetical protein [Chloroflexota bacterium]
MGIHMDSLDDKYLRILLDRIAVSKSYKPKFGNDGEGVSLDKFRSLYGSDPFYNWFGLDNPLMYAAHKAAGGITSIYRQIGIGGEALLRQLIQDHLGLTSEQANWSYKTVTSGRPRTLKLDARIEPLNVADIDQRQKITNWMQKAARQLQLEERVAKAMGGIVMEVRQGYKSKDSKRQNADMANAAEAYTKGYLPILVVLSNQIDGDIAERYERGKWLVLRGSLEGSDLFSTYAFSREIIGYDLAGFFQRNNEQLKNFTKDILESLLRANGDE